MLRYFHILWFVFFPLILSASTELPVKSKSETESVSTHPGYTVLRIFLEDEQYLTAIRHFKTILSFTGTRQAIAELADDIADISEHALEQLEELADEKPEIRFDQLDEKSVAVSTLDSLRYTTAKQFLHEIESFDKNLLISQVQILPVIAQLASTLEENETSMKRKHWLHKLSLKYTVLYRRATALLSVSHTGN